MKKIILIAIWAIICLAFTAPIKQQREYTLTEGEVRILFVAFETAKKTLPTSPSISAADANQAFLAIDSVTRVIIEQNRRFVQKDSIQQQELQSIPPKN